jgi:hypothetical protein
MTLFEERDLARWSREARAWLAHEDRRRTIGLVVLSVAISIAMSLIATAVVGLVSRRRDTRGDVAPMDVGEPLAEVAPASEEAVGVPVMAADGALAEVEPVQGSGA